MKLPKKGGGVRLNRGPNYHKFYELMPGVGVAHSFFFFFFFGYEKKLKNKEREIIKVNTVFSLF